ncbi:MAG: hypothetical protein AAF039_12520 [Bacteroidota bacterium]
MHYRIYFHLFIFILIVFQARAQSDFLYEPSASHPYGLPNPNAPENIKDWEELIGECECESFTFQKDRTWSEPVKAIWRFKYIMNGTAVQDESLKSDGIHAGSIRQFDSEGASWNVHYYSASAAPQDLQSWNGKRDGDKIELYNEQKAPNGMDGFYKIAFTDISRQGFNWLGQWVSPDESIKFPLWKINCIKTK